MGLRMAVERSLLRRLFGFSERNSATTSGNDRWLADLVRIIRRKPPKVIKQKKNFRRVEDLSAKMWGGFSTYAILDLQAICLSKSAQKLHRLEAAWELGRWHRFHRNYDAVLEALSLVSELNPDWRFDKRFLLLEADILLRQGKRAEAQQLVFLASKRYGYDPDLCLLSANALIGEADPANAGSSSDDRRLEHINRIFSNRGLELIRKIDPIRALALDNLTASMPPGLERSDGAKISVILPAYNASSTIAYALRGVCEQTWRNLEILVVDDASSDDTMKIVSAAATQDSRIKLIYLRENSGTYVARNEGLKVATGEFITTHDADDWSHSQKLATQMDYIAEHDLVGCTSHWVRTARNLRFNGRWRPADQLQGWNLSSLLVPTELVRDLGGWDPVRFSGDTEFVRRIQAAVSAERLPKMSDGIPWSFGLDERSTLTRSTATHIRSLHFGARQEYLRAYRRWHEKAKNKIDLRLDADTGKRKFPAPAEMMSRKSAHREYDVVFVCDFALFAGAFISTYNCILAALKQGLRVGVFHWPRYDLPVSRRINDRLAQLIDEFLIDIIVVKQKIHTKHLVFYYPTPLQHKLDAVPNISFERMLVIVNQMAHRRYDGCDPQYDPSVVAQNLKSLFGCAGNWFAISQLARNLMKDDPRYPAPGGTIWTPMLDTDFWCSPGLRWRGAARPTPVIGRHGRDHYTKWPKNVTTLMEAYCIGEGWDTRFMGGAEHAIGVLGEQPKHWTVWPYDHVPVSDFLLGLDFLIHFPHEDYIEEFGRCVMEAMAIGVPVILPPRFKETFGGAAIYCESGEVIAKIRRLWNSEDEYLARARIGREFVLQNCALRRFPERLKSSPGDAVGTSL